MTRFTDSLIAVLLCGTMLTGCASGGGLTDMFSSKKPTQTAKADAAAKTDAAAQPVNTDMAPMDIESGVRQAQALREAHQYDEAIHTLSQLMLVASDDARVIGEYGKTLTEKGRAQDAVQFLTRATQLQPADWSLYSALGVAYDQVGDQSSARMAYEHALKLNPTEPSILNNYALSRMLANDPDTARQLIARAEAAGGASDAKISRNIELVNKLVPTSQAAPEQKAAAAEPPVPASTPVAVNSAPLPPAAQKTPDAPAAAPKVVMQAVPVDPLAGPVKSANHEPTPLVTHTAAQKIEAPKSDTKSDVKSAKAEPAKVEPVKASTVKAETAKPTNAVATAKPEVKPEAKPAKAEVKPGTKMPAKPGSKSIPALRQTASAY